MAKKSQGVDETATPGQGQPLDEHPRPRSARPAGAPLRTAAEAKAAAPPAADHQCTPTKIKKTGSNGDEKNIKGADGKPSYAGNFSKGLPHDNFGEVDRAAYKTLLHALDQETDFDKITLGLGRKLTNPQAGLATDPEGPDPKDLEILAAPKLESAEEAAEGVELYWMALLRDVPFTDFATNPDVATAAAELSGLTDFTGPKIGGQVTPRTIFPRLRDGGPRRAARLPVPAPRDRLWGADDLAEDADRPPQSRLSDHIQRLAPDPERRHAGDRGRLRSHPALYPQHARLRAVGPRRRALPGLPQRLPDPARQRRAVRRRQPLPAAPSGREDADRLRHLRRPAHPEPGQPRWRRGRSRRSGTRSGSCTAGSAPRRTAAAPGPAEEVGGTRGTTTSIRRSSIPRR